jgi:sulfur transfer protein SufE
MMRNEREIDMTMWFETMTYEEKRYRYLLRTGGTAAAIAEALEKLKEVRRKS